MDAIDLEVAGLRRIEVARARTLLADLGFDVTGYDLPPYPHRLQQRTRSHPNELQLAAAIVARRVAVERTYRGTPTRSPAVRRNAGA